LPRASVGINPALRAPPRIIQGSSGRKYESILRVQSIGPNLLYNFDGASLDHLEDRSLGVERRKRRNDRGKTERPSNYNRAAL